MIALLVATSADPTNGGAEITLSKVVLWTGAHLAPLVVGLLFMALAVYLLFRMALRALHGLDSLMGYDHESKSSTSDRYYED